MKLEKENVELFYKLMWGVMFYVNNKYHIIKNLETPNFKGQEIQDVEQINRKVFSNPILITQFIEENPLKFNPDEINIIKEWGNKFVKDKFFIFSIGEKIIFLNGEKDTKAYEVLGLYDEIKDIIPFEPYIAETILLPFRGKIIYSGFLHGFSISFGSGMRRTITEDFFKAKRKYGLISSLDHPIIEKNESSEELLNFYLKDARNRYEHEEDIQNLLKKYPELEKAYHQELGKINSRKIRKRFLQLGILSGWFAIFNDNIIASGKTKKEVLGRIKEIVPEELKERVFLFEHKAKNEVKNENPK
mgnify:FL=1